MKVGVKGYGGQPGHKCCVPRHKSRSRKGGRAAERAIETRVRRDGKKECKEAAVAVR